jgi:hypothetical protein
MNPASPSVRAIVIGADRSEQLSMFVTRREFPEASDYWDGNWVYATIRIRAGAFRGEYEALLRTNELASFRDQLATLHAALEGSATFETMEHWLRVDILGDGRGHADRITRTGEYLRHQGFDARVDGGIEELNQRFKENGVGFQYEEGELVRVDSDLLHAEAVKPALTLLRTKRYAGPREEFLRAYEHYRHERHEEALTEALKASAATS